MKKIKELAKRAKNWLENYLKILEDAIEDGCRDCHFKQEVKDPSLNSLRDKVHENAVKKGFYDCPECNGSGEALLKGTWIGLKMGTCEKCNGTGKDQDKNFGELLMLVVSELGEAVEADRKGMIADKDGYEHHLDYIKEGFSKSQFELDIKDSKQDEIADSLIRIMDLCGYYNIDIDWHVKEKMKYNATREAKHGKKY